EEPQKLEEEKHEPDIKELGHLFFLSYKFSQGNGTAQEIIFKYLKTKHPQWVLTQEFLERMKNELIPKFSRYMKKGQGLVHSDESSHGRAILDDEGAVKRSVEEEILNLDMAWDAPKMDETELKKLLLANILNSDYFWTSKPNGRNKEMGERYHPDRDPFLSHLVYYGLLGHDTGSQDYNAMFRGLVEFLKEEYKQKLYAHFDQKLADVINIWNEKHPSMQFNIESLSE
ncbi:MAG: hypothetical protein HYZ69_03230, partial [Candidatus Colwellbacteria bacterium]|nr:hypothetical protein [Candidatus Colwellbacteria bacterium]